MRKIFLSAAILGLAALSACGPKKATETPSAQDYSAYVKAYTGGIVGEDAVIRVVLAEEKVTDIQPDALFQFQPPVKGAAKQDGGDSFSFVPDEGALKAGQTYSVSFALGKLFGKDAPEHFDFGITVRGKAPETLEADETPQAGFGVRKAVLQDDHIDVELSAAPVNAALKGMVELKGCTRSYVSVEGNTLRVHFEGRKEDLTLTLDPSIKDEQGRTLGTAYERTFPLQEEKPAVEIPVQGNILPGQTQVLLPFRAVNLGAVEVRVIKIYEKNVLMFLQEGSLNGGGELRRSGRLVYRGDVALDPTKNLREWNTHSLDLSGLFKQEPGAIYRIRISFRQDQSLYGGKQYLRSANAPSGKPTAEDEAIWDRTSSYYWDNDYDWDSYNYKEADDPAKPSYYMDSDRFPAVQLISSDLGLMASYAGGDRLWITATDLLTAQPVPGASVEVYDYQLQRIGTGKTDGKGLADVKVSRKPFAVVAKAGGSTAYLKVTSGNERLLSRFDVGGEVVRQGLKAFIYGERGVWRPGDTLHVTMLLSDKGRALPEGHPATLEVYTPEGQFYTKQVRRSTDGFYSYDIPTKESDPTGYWNAYFKVGGSSFHKTLHIETVKPNRLKIRADYPSLLEAGQKVNVPVSASWLTGGAASLCRVRSQLTLRKTVGSPFAGFEKYTFNNPASHFTSAEAELFAGQLSDGGQATLSATLPAAEDAPGLLNAFIVTSVQEQGGDESFVVETLPYSPFSAYVGIRVPDGDFLETDKDQTVRLAVVDAAGKRVKGHKVEYAVLRVGWNWWWDATAGSSLDTYVAGTSVKKVLDGTLTSSDKDISFNIRENYPEWGRYLILARDVTSGHVSGRLVTFDWPEYRGRAGRKDPDALTMLTFSTDKASYKIGEKATVYIPAAKDGQALVTLENAAGVVSREWVSTSDKDTPYTFTVTPEMAPNFYVDITLLQPYGFTANDLPLRLWGVQRVLVQNPDSHLTPVIQIPEVIHPEEPFLVKVSEKNGKPMTYTLAIVDEGLLDITAFKTPDPWAAMNKVEALGVNTWDLYDQVIGAYSGRLSPLAAIGGDQDAIRSARKDNRFNPVVLFRAPRTLTKGTDIFKLKLPMYVGSVRVMVIAGHDGAYGNLEKTVTVQNPLMVVTTLPRVLGTDEEVSVPVNIFAMEEGVKEATVQIKADGPVQIIGPATQKLSFSGKGDKLVRFALKSTAEGVAKITVNASGSGYKAYETTALEVRNAQPFTTQVQRFTLPAGSSETLTGGPGKTLQLSAFPAADVKQMYVQMRDYPYDCAEQLSARGITLLNLLPLLDKEDADQARSLIPGIIDRLYARQLADGGFSYWSGGKADTWVTSMAGLFLTQASNAGFTVNEGVLRQWKSFQQKTSQVYRITGNSFFSHTDEAFRLYTLASAGAASVAGMNRLRESADKIGDNARWMLAAAYCLSGKTAQADALLDAASRDFPEYEPYNLTFGSGLRDRFMAMDALTLSGRTADAIALAQSALSGLQFSTQETAFAAIALRHLQDRTASAVKAAVGDKVLDTDKAAVSLALPQTAKVQNNSDGPLYGSVVTVSREEVRKARSNGLKLEVQYLSDKGTAVNPASLPQGTLFKAVIKVTNLLPGRPLENLALSLRIPSGWEIVNERLTTGSSSADWDHRDIRDDRVNWFFALPQGRSKTFQAQLRAAYEGSYQLPSVTVDAMYEPTVNACTESGRAVVTR